MFRYILSITTINLLTVIFLISTSMADDPIRSESSMSIYSGGEKVGYSQTVIEERGSNYFINELSEIKLILLGKKQNLSTEANYTLRGYYLDSFKYKMSSDTGNLRAWGGINGNALNMKLKSPSSETDLVLDANENYTVFAILPKLLSQKPMAMGDEYKVPLFEPSAVLMGAHAKDLISTSRVEAVELINTEKGETIETLRVVTEFMGTNYTSWITRGGDVLKQTLPPGLTAKKDTEPAKNPGKLASIDIMEKTSIPTNKKIKNPRNLEYMRAQISGIDDFESMNINSGRQVFKEGVVEITVEENSSSFYELPYPGQVYQEYILPSYLIQSSDPKILDLAQKIAGSESDPRIAASKINKWMYENIKKEGTVSLPNALDVLESRKGDCNEHAALFAALSRALGIPTKVVMGTIYIDGRFYYHAWNEVFLGEWTAVDSTYGQLPADAAHIKLLEGDLKKSGEIMKLVGKIKIEVLEAS